MVFVLLSQPPSPAHAGANDNAVIALHVVRQSKPVLPRCPLGESIMDGVPCSAYTIAWTPGEAVEVYLVAARGDSAAGIGGFSCGIQYSSGVAVFDWEACAPSEAPADGWPASGGTNRLEWPDDCNRTLIRPDGVHALGGAFYVYAYGPATFEAGGEAPEVRDCVGGAPTPAVASSRIAFSDRGELKGFNPCSVVPVVPVTWGRLKHGLPTPRSLPGAPR